MDRPAQRVGQGNHIRACMDLRVSALPGPSALTVFVRLGDVVDSVDHTRTLGWTRRGCEIWQACNRLLFPTPILAEGDRKSVV